MGKICDSPPILSKLLAQLPRKRNLFAPEREEKCIPDGVSE
jgi:hypothetical protein